MKDYEGIVSILAGVDKPRPSEHEIKKLLRECFSAVNIMERTLHPTYALARIRLNKRLKSFTSTSELSYRPKEIPGSLKRASTANASMFYASSCERREVAREIPVFTDIEYGIKVALFETLSVLKEHCCDGHGRYDPTQPFDSFRSPVGIKIGRIRATYSIWQAERDIKLASVCPVSMHDEDFVDQYLQQHIFFSPYTSKPLEQASDNVLWDFLAREFSRPGEGGLWPYDYVVSANAAEVLYEMGYDGVYYPSSRCNGRGINVAITPEAVDSKLRCTRVGLVLVSSESNGAVTNSILPGRLLVKHVKEVVLPPGVRDFDLRLRPSGKKY